MRRNTITKATAVLGLAVAALTITTTAHADTEVLPNTPPVASAPTAPVAVAPLNLGWQ
ncbi:hypothetical protein [Embleya sp. AB8]|uniref:hypothetical protein n=1 Tax=Embleya sp. AB8 TaxID=3156304 RepID=UPI003C74B78E